MDRQIRNDLSGHGHDARVRHDQCIHADLFQITEIFRQFDQLVIMRDDIDRDMDFHSVAVGKDYGFFQFFIVEIAGFGSQAVLAAAQIDGIGPVQDRRL